MKTLGQTSLRISPLCFGGNVFGWTIDEAASFALLDAFVAGGGNFIDTADVYSAWAPGNRGGESETIIGKWLRRRGRRDDVVIATKVGLRLGEGREGLSRRRILEAAEESLRRLQTDYIDLYQAHRDDERVPLGETLGAFAELVRSGKVRYVGASNYPADRLAAALRTSRERKLPAFATLQPLYNLYDRGEFEAGLRTVCEEHGLAVLPYYSLASGFLTGKYRTRADLQRSPRGSRAERYLNERGLRILAALDRAAAEYGTAPATVALAWLMAQPTVAAPIASATNPEQLRQMLAAASLRLSPETLAFLARESSVR